MPSEHRLLDLAPGHKLRARQLPKPASRPGHIVVEATRRPPFEIEQARWDEAPVA